MHGGQEKTVKLTGPLPVYLGYWTARVSADGILQFRDDLYGIDARQSALLGAALDKLKTRAAAAGVEARETRAARRDAVDYGSGSGALQSGADRREEPVEVDRLRQPGVGVDRRDVVARAGGGDDHDRNAARACGSLACASRNCQPFITGIIRSSRITRERAVGLQRLERELAVRGGAHVEPFELEKPLEHLARVGIVLDDHHGRHGERQAERRPRASVIRRRQRPAEFVGIAGLRQDRVAPGAIGARGILVNGA